MGKSDLNKQLGNNSRGAGGQQAGGLSASEQQQQQLSPDAVLDQTFDAQRLFEEVASVSLEFGVKLGG